MITFRIVRFPSTLALAALAASMVRGEVLNFTGSVESRIEETRFNQPGDTNRVLEEFPRTSTTLPLQAVATLVANDPEVAAARAAGQFADPRELNQPNPEEFAINLALNSVTANTRYDARVRVEELREIVFNPGDLGDLAEGETGTAVGRLFLDGALAIFAVDPDRDLLGASVRLDVRVVRQTDADPDGETVFEGSVAISGAAAGGATVTAGGQIPVDTLILSDLSVVSEEFAAFHVLIIPPLDLPYAYEAVVGEPFTLRASVELTAQNIEREVGVAGLLGTPTDALESVIGATQGASAAGKMIAALQRERASPTGRPAFAPPPPPLCGLLGIEAVLGAALCLGARSMRVGGIGRRCA